MKLLDAAGAILVEVSVPLHVTELTRRMIEQGLWQPQGKTPVDSVRSALAVDISERGLLSRFERVHKGTFGLRSREVTPSFVDPQPVITDSTFLSSESAPDTPSLINTAKLLSFTDAAEHVLERFGKDQPLHYRDITERALGLGLITTQGKTPEATMYAQILVENGRRAKRGEAARFIQYGKGLIGLAKGARPDLADLIDTHNANTRKRLHDHL
ncbi:MAG TPA: winged helix-turn-helix domain-containing protein [Thermomicrobiales bacterium]|jgi:restriction system protein